MSQRRTWLTARKPLWSKGFTETGEDFVPISAYLNSAPTKKNPAEAGLSRYSVRQFAYSTISRPAGTRMRGFRLNA